MKNGSRKSSVPKVKVQDLADIKAPPKRRPKDSHAIGKSTALAPPQEALENPAKWSEEHLTSLMPRAVKRMEYTLMFGSDALAYQASKDILAIKGLTTKPQNQGLPPQAMVFNFGGPVTPSGVPVLPFSNATARLPAPLTAPDDVVTVSNDDDDDEEP
jgi:hypothetical protein